MGIVFLSTAHHSLCQFVFGGALFDQPGFAAAWRNRNTGRTASHVCICHPLGVGRWSFGTIARRGSCFCERDNHCRLALPSSVLSARNGADRCLVQRYVASTLSDVLLSRSETAIDRRCADGVVLPRHASGGCALQFPWAVGQPAGLRPDQPSRDMAGGGQRAADRRAGAATDSNDSACCLASRRAFGAISIGAQFANALHRQHGAAGAHPGRHLNDWRLVCRRTSGARYAKGADDQRRRSRCAGCALLSGNRPDLDSATCR